VFSIQAPTNCPSCDSMLEWSNHLLYCRNTSCDSQSQKRVQHFAKTLKIKGLGPAAVEKLGLTSPHDIYQLSLEDIVEGLNSEKLAEKLLVEIQNSEKASLNEILPALSIPLIGKTATEKLSVVCDDIYDINTESCKRAGLGPKATESLVEFLAQEDLDYMFLPHSMQFRKAAKVETKGVVCISGRLKSFKTKAEATQALSVLGYRVVGSLTKEVSILVNESGIESAKTTKARESGVTIIENLLDFIGD
jgi:DNA ligase (NAD+)